MEKQVEVQPAQPVVVLSLYDYLKRPAGSVLGKQVAEYAKLRKARRPEANGPSSPTASNLRTLTKKPRTE